MCECERTCVCVVPLVESPVFGHVIFNLHQQITLQVKFPQCCTSTCYHVHLPTNLCDLVTDSATTTTATAGCCSCSCKILCCLVSLYAGKSASCLAYFRSVWGLQCLHAWHWRRREWPRSTFDDWQLTQPSFDFLIYIFNTKSSTFNFANSSIFSWWLFGRGV